MSFAKAEQLLDLAAMLSARHMGVTLDDVMDRYDISKRTAQRMLGALGQQFNDLETMKDFEGRKRWRLNAAPLRDLLSLDPEEIAALDLAIEQFRRQGVSDEVAHLERLREKVLSLVPRPKKARLETDHDALLEAQGFVARPGPRPLVDETITQAVVEAIKGFHVLRIWYQSNADAEPRERLIEPYGILSGFRRYVVARAHPDPTGPVRHFRAEGISDAELTDETFERDVDFNLKEFAERAFGVYQNDDEFGKVRWRFSPSAAQRAKQFVFHPQQVVEEQEDGSLIVSFKAAGHVEMCWHLYAWGDHVEVLEPKQLRDLCAGYQRSDFPALP